MILLFHQEVSGSRSYNERSVSWDEIVPREREPSEFKGRRRMDANAEKGDRGLTLLCVHHRWIAECVAPDLINWKEALPGMRCTAPGCGHPADAEGVLE